MKNSRFVLLAWVLAGLFLLPVPGWSSPKKAQPPEEESEAVRQVADRIIAREDQVIVTLSKYQPRVETYVQFVRPDQELGSVPVNDRYYLGRLDLDKRIESESFLPQSYSRFNFFPRFLSKALIRPFNFNYNLNTLVEAAVIDPKGLDRKSYHFQFVRTEFLGDVRCLVFDLVPRPHSGTGRFKGRIWVEDRDYTIVRFKGVRTSPPRFHVYYHFDSWRENLQPGIWLPVIIYFEESGLTPPTFLSVDSPKTWFRAQTRFWGYDLSTTAREDELTRILVEAPAPVRDSSEGADLSPLASQRQWESEAESNVIERLEKARLIAPPGEVDKVLETVVNNMVVTNKLDSMPPIHCRVMLTLPFESFTVGHTIVVSRGLIDVLPDEATLATVLAHELAHLVLGHVTDTSYAFNDRLLIDDQEILSALDFERDPQEESAADDKALELLQNSPYRNKLSTAGLFLRAMADEALHLRQMFGAHLGNRLAEKGHDHRMVQLKSLAPELQPRQIDQIAAFPLGTRLKVDPWDGRVEMMKSKPAAPLSAREKMPFMVTPLFPHLTRKETTVSGPLTGQAKTEGTPPLPQN
jgi:hypothetical protein